MLPETESDFTKARNKAFFNELQHLLNPEETKMISFKQIKSLLKPQNQTYIGMKTIPISKIVGSEGRYKDFDNQFFPKSSFLKERWEHVDEAVIKDIVLPPIRVYELGGLYFVRDGNHRVSVAKSKGVEFIDADIISLQTEIKLSPVRTLQGMIKQIISWEKKNFYFETNFGDITDFWCLDFSLPGQYDIIYQHILTHKYFINQGINEEIPIEEAIISWYSLVYLPVVKTIEKYKITRYVKATESDLYVWIITFWDDLKHKLGDEVELDTIVKDISLEYKSKPFMRLRNAIGRLILKKRISKVK
ncbi:MAG: transcriptional regulator [Treponema sp.]|nr:transcriptional regulator [Treponema sp.]